MSKRTLLNLVLLVVVAVLVLIVVYEPGVEKKINPPLAVIDKASISKITIERNGQPPVSLQKINDSWMMKAPFQVTANTIKSESLLGLFEQETFAQYPLKELDAKTYGLDIPRASIIFNDQYRFDFGATEPLNKRRYVRHNQTLYVIDDHFYYQLMSPVTVFVNHKLLPDSDNITRLVLPAFTLTLHDGSWQIEPESTDFSNDQANELIENWKLTHAMHISEYDGRSDKQLAKVYLDNNEVPIVFHIIQEKDNFYLGRADLGIKYQIVEDKSKDLLKLPVKLDLPITEPPAPAVDNKTNPTHNP